MVEYWYLADDWLYRHAGMPPILEWPWLHILFLVVSALALLGALKLWLNPPSFDDAKWWGIDRKNYRCIRPLAGLAVFEAAISGLLSAIGIVRPAMMPMPVDIIAFVVLLLSSWLLYRSLCKRETFKHARFRQEVLLPLGVSFVVALPGGFRGVPKAVTSVSKLAGVSDLAGDAKRLVDDSVGRHTLDTIDSLASRARDSADEAIEWIARKLPREVDAITVCGRKRFVSRTALGGVGEAVTKKHYEAMGLTYFKSQVGSKGIDAVFAKFGKAGNLLEVYVVETKTNGSRLRLGQMADEWIRNGCRQARKNADASHAAELVEKALDPANGVILHRELMHVATDTGNATRYSVAATGEIATKQWSGNASEAVAEVISRMETQGSCRALPDLAGSTSP